MRILTLSLKASAGRVYAFDDRFHRMHATTKVVSVYQRILAFLSGNEILLVDYLLSVPRFRVTSFKDRWL